MNVDTVVEIFDIFYPVQIQPVHLRDAEDLRKIGYRSTGFRDMDKSIQLTFMTVGLPISDIAEKFSEGVPLKISGVENLKAIYKSITNHIAAWAGIIRSSVNYNAAPVDDLVKLDHLAQFIFERLREDVAEDVYQSELIDRMRSQYVGIQRPISLIKAEDRTRSSFTEVVDTFKLKGRKNARY